MSDETKEPANPKKGKTPPEVEREQPEPVPKRPDFFEYLESLFDGEGKFPERIDVRIVRGKDLATMGPKIKTYEYPAGSKKPTREKLVAMSNEILYRVQQDCDVQRKRVSYQVAPLHFTTDSEFYSRYIIGCMPGSTFKNGENGENDDDDEEKSIEKRFSVQLMKHQEIMFERHGAALEGLIDRQDRHIERLIARNEQLESRVEKQNDQMERMRSADDERADRRAWNALKIKGVEKGMDLALAMAPPLVNQIAGKNVVPTQDTPETIALKEFLKPAASGGKLTQDQAHAAFGVWDGTPDNKLITPGVLLPQQVALLHAVAFGEVSPNELNNFMPGAGPLAITMEQVAALQQIFPFDQLMPIMMIFEARRPK